MKEELGVEIEIESFLFNIENRILGEREYWFCQVYLCRVKSGKVENLEDEKHEKIAWFEIDKPPRITAYGTQEILEKLKSILEKLYAFILFGPTIIFNQLKFQKVFTDLDKKRLSNTNEAATVGLWGGYLSD
ncbi:MAG: hypothetical protein KatS3mg090_0425 [Patescibacteria group bacterium]|nr:MAG: hypothetical protein KatS3mg090_0425 [Patescibacteria group bacterium]